MGAPMPTPMAVSIKEPTIALAKPPPVLLGGGVFWVSRSRLKPGRPLLTSVPKIITSHVSPNKVAP